MNNTNSYLIKEKQVEMASWLKKKKKSYLSFWNTEIILRQKFKQNINNEYVFPAYKYKYFA